MTICGITPEIGSHWLNRQGDEVYLWKLGDGNGNHYLWKIFMDATDCGREGLWYGTYADGNKEVGMAINVRDIVTPLYVECPY
jgi:hypothetical protein